MKYQVSRIRGHSAVDGTRAELTAEEAGDQLAKLLREGNAVVVTRMDWTPEARRAKWEADFYDVDRAGRRRRRYRRTPLEREWEEMLKTRKQEERAATKTSVAEVKQGILKCKSCGSQWHHGAGEHGLHHECGKGLVSD